MWFEKKEIHSHIILAKFWTFLRSQISKSCLFLKSGNTVLRTVGALSKRYINKIDVYNLMDGSGLTSDPGFGEDTNDSRCTQRSSANCDIY